MKILPESFGEIFDGVESFFFEVAGTRRNEKDEAVRSLSEVAVRVHGVEPYVDPEAVQAQVQETAPRVGRLVSVETGAVEAEVQNTAPSVAEVTPQITPATVGELTIDELQARVAAVHNGTYQPQTVEPVPESMTPRLEVVKNSEDLARIEEAQRRVQEVHGGYQEAA